MWSYWLWLEFFSMQPFDMQSGFILFCLQNFYFCFTDGVSRQSNSSLLQALKRIHGKSSIWMQASFCASWEMTCQFSFLFLWFIKWTESRNLSLWRFLVFCFCCRNEYSNHKIHLSFPRADFTVYLIHFYYSSFTRGQDDDLARQPARRRRRRRQSFLEWIQLWDSGWLVAGKSAQMIDSLSFNAGS